MVCLADPAIRSRARRDIKDMIEQRLTYRKEVLLHDEVPPIPNVRRTKKELARSPVYKRTKTMIPKRINKILINKSRQVFNETQKSGSPESEKTATLCSTYLDSDHDFGYYNRSKRKKSTTIQDLTLQLKETRRLLDVLKESEEVAAQETSSDKPVRRRIDLEGREDGSKKRPEPKIADFISAKELDCESIDSREDIEVDKFDVKSSYQDDDLEEFEKFEKHVSKRNTSVDSAAREESDPFTDSDYMELGVSLQEELDISKEYESDRFSMCSEKISHMEARKMLSESEQRCSAILDSCLDRDTSDSFLENERLMQQQTSKIDDLLSIPSSVEDLRFDKEELPLLTRSSDTGSTTTEKEPKNVMVPVQHVGRDRPSVTFSKQNRAVEGRVVQPTPIKPAVEKPTPSAKAKESIDFNNYESDLNEIENLLFKYDEYRVEQELKKSDKTNETGKISPRKIAVVGTVGYDENQEQKPTKKIAAGISKGYKTPSKANSAGASNDITGMKKENDKGIAKGVRSGTAIQKRTVAAKTVPSTKASAGKSLTVNRAEKSPPKPQSKTIAKPSNKDDIRKVLTVSKPESEKPASPGKSATTATQKQSLRGKPSPTSTVSKIAVPNKSVPVLKTAAGKSSGQKLTKPAVTPKSTIAKSEAGHSTKTATTSPSKTSDQSGSNNTISAGGKSKPPINSNSKTVPEKPSVSLKASAPNTLSKIPGSRFGTTKSNYVSSAKIATGKSPAINRENNSSSLKSIPNHTKTAGAPDPKKSSPAKGPLISKISPPKSGKLQAKISPEKTTGTNPKLNQEASSGSTNLDQDQPKKSPSKKKITTLAEKPVPTNKSSTAVMKPSMASKHDIGTKPSIASKLAPSSSKSKTSTQIKPSLTTKSSPSETTATKASPSPSKISAAKASPAKISAAKASPNEISAANASPNKISVAKSSPTKLSAAKASPNKISVAKASPSPNKSSAAKNTPMESIATDSSEKSPVKTPLTMKPQKVSTTKISPEKSTAAKLSAAKIAPNKANAKSPPKILDSSKNTSKTSESATANDRPASKLSPPKSTSTLLKSAATATKNKTAASPTKINMRASTSPNTAAIAKKPVTAAKPALIKTKGGLVKPSSKESVKDTESNQSKDKSPSTTSSKIPSPSKSTTSPTKSSTSKELKKPEVSPKPKLKVGAKASVVKTIQKPKPVMRF